MEGRREGKGYCVRKKGWGVKDQGVMGIKWRRCRILVCCLLNPSHSVLDVVEQWESWCWRIEAVSERDELGDRWRKVERGNGRNQSCFLHAPLCFLPLSLSFLCIFLFPPSPPSLSLPFFSSSPSSSFSKVQAVWQKKITKDSALDFETFWNQLLGSNRTLSWNQTISSGCAPEAVGSCWWRVLCLFLPLLLFHLTDSLHPEILRENVSLLLLLLDFGYAGFLLTSDVILKSSTGVVPFYFFSCGGRGQCVLSPEVLVFRGPRLFVWGCCGAVLPLFYAHLLG